MASGFKVSGRVGAGSAHWPSPELPSPPSPDACLPAAATVCSCSPASFQVFEHTELTLGSSPHLALWLALCHCPGLCSNITSWERPFWTPGLRSFVGQSLPTNCVLFFSKPWTQSEIILLTCVISSLPFSAECRRHGSRGLFAHCSIHGARNPLKS